MNLISNPAERAARAADKQAALLEFLRDETWSTSEVLGAVAGLQSRQAIHRTLTQMEQLDLVRRASLPMAGRRPLTAWGLTAHGLAMSYGADEEYEPRPLFEPSKLTLSRIPHQVELQLARQAAEAAGWTGWTRGERLGFRTAIRPDAVATTPNGTTVAIELERTIKTRKRYQVIIREHLQKIRAGDWATVIYVSPDGMAARVKKVFDSIEYVSFEGQRAPLEEQHRRRFRFIELSDWPNLEKLL